MSAFRILYDDVFNALEASTVIQTVGDYNEQYENAEDYNLVKYPAVYVESGNVEWNKNQNNFWDFQKEPQTGTAEIIVHVVYHTLKPFDKTTKDAFYDHVDHVSSILQKLQCTRTEDGTYSTLLRTEEEYDAPVKQLRVARLTFETQLTDIFVQNTTAAETITITLNTDIDSE